MPFGFGDPASAGWNSYNFADTNSGLNSDLLGSVSQSRRTAVSGDGKYQLSYYGGAPSYTSNGSDDWNASYNNPEYWMNDLHQGPGSAVRVYDKTGKFLRNETGSGIISPIQGVAMVAGAGLGFGALGAAAGGAGTASGAGGFVGEGAASGVPAWDGALANAGAGSAAAGGAGAASGMSGTPPPTNPYSTEGFLQSLAGKVSPQQIASLGQALGGGGGSSNGGGMDLNSILNAAGPLVGGLSSAYNQGQASSKMIDWLNGQQGRIDNLYSPDSPEFKSLWDQMSAKDAAAGRNSQYGPRAVDLAGHIAQIKADANARLSGAFARPYADALNQNAGRFAGLGAAAGNAGGLGALINAITGGRYGNMGGSPPNPFYGTGGGNTDVPFGSNDPGYVDPSTVNYTGDFQFPDAGAGDWGNFMNEWSGV